MIPQDIFQSNRDLTPGERHDVKQLAQDTDSKLKAVKEGISKLKQEQKELLKIAKNCRLALAPIRRIPREVIGEIFLECVRSEKPSMSSYKAPALLTHICSDLRHIALSLPTLWATFALDIPEVRGGKDEDDEHRINQAKLYLWSLVDTIGKWTHRSGAVPLSIECTSSIEYDILQRFEEEEYALADILLSSAARWRHLTLGFKDCSPLFVRIMELTPDKAPLLTALRILCEGDMKSLPGNIFQACSLTDLSLNGLLDASDYHVNWSRLTQLNLNIFPSDSTVEILRQAKNVIRLSFEDSKSDDEDIDDIYLPYLQELIISEDGFCVGRGPLAAAYIHAPALETLHADIGVTLLSNLVKRSPRLRNLEIRPDNPDEIGAWLRNCPQITSLVISTYSAPNRTHSITGLLEELVRSHGGTYTCPNLRIFQLNDILATPSDVLCQFLGAEHGRSVTPLSRTWEQVSLKVFITDWGSKNKNSKALNKVVKKLKRAGVLKLEIINTGRPRDSNLY